MKIYLEFDIYIEDVSITKMIILQNGCEAYLHRDKFIVDHNFLCEEVSANGGLVLG